MRNLLFFVFAAGAAAWPAAAAPGAWGFGPAGGTPVLGQPLALSVPVTLPSPAPEDLCLRAQVRYGDNPLDDSQVQVRWQGAEGRGRVQVLTASAIDEPVVQVVLSMGCAQALSRSYTLLPELMVGAPAEPATAASPVVAPVQPAPPAARPERTVTADATPAAPATRAARTERTVKQAEASASAPAAAAAAEPVAVAAAATPVVQRAPAAAPAPASPEAAPAAAPARAPIARPAVPRTPVPPIAVQTLPVQEDRSPLGLLLAGSMGALGLGGAWTWRRMRSGAQPAKPAAAAAPASSLQSAQTALSSLAPQSGAMEVAELDLDFSEFLPASPRAA
jgi:hypothetical protein